MPDRKPVPVSPGSRPPSPNAIVQPITVDLNKLINSYLKYGGELFTTYLPLALIAVLLIAVMLIAAYQFLKE